MTGEKMTLQEMQTHIKKICAERGWDKNSHLEIFLLFSEEVGELAKSIRKITALHEEIGNEKDFAKKKTALEEEFADVLNYLIDLANYFDVDLTKAFAEKDKKNSQRTWD
jgi:NTP pyrophosphatase (non-canonical NTP hydrolase)